MSTTTTMLPVYVIVPGRPPKVLSPNWSPPDLTGRMRRIIQERESRPWIDAIVYALRDQLRHRHEWERDALRDQPLTLHVTVVYPPRGRRIDGDNLTASLKKAKDSVSAELGRRSDFAVELTTEQRLSGSVDRSLFDRYPDGWTSIDVRLVEE